ncbi:NAD-dependent epimerase/dehydratase family protein [Roseomonas rosulenta]|uniref:NAD-dependent epimerase/dehydratase family protein n=1 Tax=Roseomonas rosulenta TaxID=2748667 RepID=UPI0018DF8E58|nr:NAD-dependent epimerase/dehydratase family protein [Roseomonas rosulenta]
MRRILVTGGCGFIGSHLCEALAARGDTLRVLDDLSTGKADALPEGAELLRGDVADPGLVREAMAGVDGCVHLAAIASVEKGVQDWLGTHRTNLTGAITVFDAARRAAAEAGRPIPVVYASSAAVYGDASAQPIEESAPLRPLSAYGADKLGCELHARVAGAVHGVPTLGLRFFNVFGPRQAPGSPYSGVISIFCDRVRRGAPVRIYGDGLQTRDFIYVGDVVAALLAGFAAASAAAPVYNVCSGEACSVLDLLGRIARLSGTEPVVMHEAPRKGEIRHSLGSPRMARERLGLGPARDIDLGLRQVLDWMAREVAPQAASEKAQQ